MPSSPDLADWRALLVPAVWGGIIYSLALSDRRSRARVMVALVASTAAMAYLSASSAWRSTCDALPTMNLLRAGLARVVLKLLVLGGLLLIAAALSAWKRIGGRGGWVAGALDAALLLLAIPVLLKNRIFPAQWSPSDVRRVSWARLTANGNLLLEAEWKGLRGTGGGIPATAMLLRHPGSLAMQCLHTGSATPMDNSRILAQDQQWWRLVFGDWSVTKLLDPRTRAEETITHSRVRCAIDPDCSQRSVQTVVGPRNAWAIAEGQTVRGRLASGERFSLPLPKHLQRAWKAGPYLVLSFHDDSRWLTSPGPLLVKVDWESGAPTFFQVPRSSVLGDVSPNGQSLVLADREGRYVLDAKNRLTRLAVREGQKPILVWRTDGTAFLLNLAAAAPPVVEALPPWTTLREFHGKLIGDYSPDAEGKTRYLAILDRALTRVDRVPIYGYGAIQWLEDSILFVERDEKAERIIRYWPDPDRRDVLLSVPL